MHTYIHLQKWWKNRFKCEHHSSASQPVCGEVYLYFCSQVNRCLVLLYMILLCMQCSTCTSPQAFDRLGWISVHLEESIDHVRKPNQCTLLWFKHFQTLTLCALSSLCTSNESFTNWSQYADNTLGCIDRECHLVFWVWHGYFMG